MGKFSRQKALLLLALLDDSLSTCWSAWTFPSASINATTIGRPRFGLPLTSLGGSCRPACWRLVIWLGAPYRTCERHPTTATATSWSETQLETHHYPPIVGLESPIPLFVHRLSTHRTSHCGSRRSRLPSSKTYFSPIHQRIYF